MPATARRLAAFAAATLLLAGCDQNPADPSSLPGGLEFDVAQLATQSASVDIEMMGGPAGAGGMGLYGGLIAGPFGPLASRDLGCRNHTPPGLTITRTCTFADAGGAAQVSYDPATTATATVVTAISGEISRGNWTASLSRSSEVTVSGLAGDETQRTWNGNGEESVSRSQHTEGNGTRAYTVETTFLIADVVVPVQVGGPRWPLSGSITRTIEGDITEGPRAGESFSRTTTITFNGTAMVTLTVNGEEFTVDLAARRAARRR